MTFTMSASTTDSPLLSTELSNVGFPQYERMLDVVRKMEWLEQINVLVVLRYQQIAGQASTVKKQGGYLVAADCDTIGRYHEMPMIALEETQDIQAHR